jgi:hypothetical protein
MEMDPEEAGFSRYFVQPEAAIESLFKPEYGEFSDVRCPIYFVPGNHEDYEFSMPIRLVDITTKFR